MALHAVSEREYNLMNARNAPLLPEFSATWHAHSALVVQFGFAIADVELREKAVAATTAKAEIPSSVLKFFMMITLNKSGWAPGLVGFATVPKSFGHATKSE
jgi:hypothetical protein